VISELSLLRVLLLLSMAVAPLGTHRFFFSAHSRARGIAHAVSLACAAMGLFSPAPILCVVWLLFCAVSFALFLRDRMASLREGRVLAACVPFLFSNVAAVWLVGGANDLGILGYGAQFSYYAALHGNVLGWMVVGALAVLADREGPARGVYLAAVLACFVSFLLIAIGIDQLRAVKPIGVVGLSVALPIAQLVFLRGARRRSRPAFALGCVSLGGLVLTMVLAWRNELSLPVLPDVLGVRAMVSVHGVLNALVVAPCFLLAVVLDTPRAKSEERGAR
jgi:YndJ-like protein